MSAMRSALPGGEAIVAPTRRKRLRRRRATIVALAALLVGGFAWIAVARFTGGSEPAAPAEHAQAAASAAQAPSFRRLLPLLTRSGAASGGVELELTYAPPLFFKAIDEKLPGSALEQPTLVFFLREAIHEGLLPAAAPAVFLRIDGGTRSAPYERTVVSNDPHHRMTRLQFAAVGADGLPLSVDSEHVLALVVPRKDRAVSAGDVLTWRLPLSLPGTVAAPSAAPNEQAQAGEAETDSGPLDFSSLSRPLRKVRHGVGYGGVSDVELEAIYATPKYFEAALPADATPRYTPSRNVVFIVSETSHSDSLPAKLPPLALHVAGRTYLPDLQEQKIGSPHHRVTFVRFPADSGLARQPGVMKLGLPDGSGLAWSLPIRYDGGGAMSPFGLPWASLLALLGGFLGAMWPCLFQLTVFFMPTLAGLSTQEAGSASGLPARRQIARAAFYFVLGFTIVYTSAGALIGFAASRLQDTAVFETWQRYIGIGAGFVILFLAFRVAARGRAPLICKMPLIPRMAKRSGATRLEMMLAGLAFATGCMTCFGSALVIGMVVYVGLANSALYGALILFIFSMGMGIPLALAAMAMGRVMPLFSRLEKATPWMALASSLLMVGFAALLFSGNYMAISQWLYRLT